MSAPMNELKWNTADNLGTGVSLDSVRRPGFYGVTNPVGLSAGDYHVLVMKGFAVSPGVHNVKQVAYQVGNASTRVRDFNGSSWTAWANPSGGSGSVVDLTTGTRTSTALPVVATNDQGAGAELSLPLATSSLAGIISAAAYATVANLRVFNVLDYGASGTGGSGAAATNRTAFENAIVAAAAAGGGTIYAPRGTYYISYGGSASVGGIRLRDNMTLAGDGMGATIIKCANIGNNDLAGLVRTQSGVQNTNIVVRDLTIDGNKAEQTGWANIICFFAGVTPNDRVNTDKDIWCLNVECKNGKNGTTGSANLTRGYGFDPHEVVERFAAVNCIAHDNERDGFVLDGVIDFSLVGCKSWDNGRHGFNFITETFNGVVTGCQAWDNGDNNYVVQGDSHHINFTGNLSRGGGENGLRIRRGGTIVNTHIVWTGNTIETAAKNGIQLTGGLHNIITSNLFINNSQLTHNTYFDISLDEDDGDTLTFTAAMRNIVSNNYAVAYASNKTKAAYREDELATAPSLYNTYAWNHAFGQVNAKYDDGISTTSKILDAGYITVYDAAQHGVAADGATDNRVALRALVDLVSARGGGEIALPPGVILASGTGTESQGIVALPSNVHLSGAGIGTTILRAINPVNNNINGVIRTLSGGTNANISVRDLTVEAQNITGTGYIAALTIDGASDDGIHVERVKLTGGQNGTSTSGYGARVVGGAQNIYLTDIIADANERDNILIDGATHVHLTRPYLTNAGRHNLNITNAAHTVNINDARIEGATTNNLIVSEEANNIHVRGGRIVAASEDNVRVRRGTAVFSTRVFLRGVHILTAGRDGVSFAGAQHNGIQDCVFEDNGGNTNNTYADVSFETDATYTGTKAEYILCSGNQHFIGADGSAPANKVDYFYAERTSAGSNNLVLWNQFYGAAATGNYLLAAASTTVFRDHTSAATAAGSDNQFQYNNGGPLGGASGLTYDETNNRPVATNGAVVGVPGSIVAPSAAQIAHIAASRGAATLPAYVSTRRNLLQSAFFDRNVGMFLPVGTGTTGTGLAIAYSGTVTAASPASTNKYTSLRRSTVSATAAASAVAGAAQNSRNLWRGNASGLGGFAISVTWGISSTLTAPRLFAGLAASTTPIVDAAEPSAAVNIFGVGCDTSQTTLRLLTNDGSGTATATDLGANYPITNGVFYEFFAYSEPNGSTIEWFLRRLDSAFETSGTVSTDLPANNIFLALQAAVDTSATNEAVSMDLFGMYFETPII